MLVLAGEAGTAAGGSCGWKLSATVEPEGASAFHGVDARAANDVWAVGEQAFDDPGDGTPLVEHWNGRRWRLVYTPVGTGVLNEVAAIAPDNAWAVGAARGRALIEHWDGAAWRKVPSPNVGSSALASVAAATPENAWAVGWRGNAERPRPLVEHWDGTRWHVISTPASTASESLTEVSIAPAGEVWTNCLASSDGSRWQVRVPTGFERSGCPFLGGVAVDAHDPGDVWVDVGVLARWDGTHWQRHPLYADGVSVAGIAVISSRNVWVGGSQLCCGGANVDYLAHWNGRRWTMVKSVFPYDVDNAVDDIAAVSSSNLWAVGYGGGGIAHAEHYLCSH
jgi:hypothetical protein